MKKLLIALIVAFVSPVFAGNYSCTLPVDIVFTCSPTNVEPVPSTTPPVSQVDPGNGLWVPPNTTGRVIANRGGSSTIWTGYIPGCINGQFASNSSTGCAANSAYTGVLSGTSTKYTFSFGDSKILGIRYLSKTTAGTTTKSVKLSSGDGGNTGSAKMWLSDDSTASFEGTVSACRSTSTTHPIVITGPGYCPITGDKRYYLFVSTDVVGNSNIRYQVIENTSDFQ